MSVLTRFGGKSDAGKNYGLTKLCGAVGVCWKTVLKLLIDYFLTRSDCALFMVKLCCNVGLSLLLFLVSQSATRLVKD